MATVRFVSNPFSGERLPDDCPQQELQNAGVLISKPSETRPNSSSAVLSRTILHRLGVDGVIDGGSLQKLLQSGSHLGKFQRQIEW